VSIEGLLGGAASVLVLLGLALATIGMYGLVLKPDIFDQLHVAGLVSGAGVILVLLAAIGTANAEILTSALLVLAFVLVTSSISTHVIAYAGQRRYGAASAAAPAAVTPGAGREPIAEPSAGGMLVLVAHDGSPAAELGTRLAASMAWPPGTIVRVIEVAPPDRSAPSPVVRAAAQAFAAPGVHAETVLAHGDPADAIVDAAAAFSADVLITGARRRGPIQTLLGISAAGDIVDRAPCPVLVARAPSLRSVLLTTDGSSQSAAATEVVAQWPVFDLARIHVVTVSAAPAATPEDRRTVDLTAAPLMDAGRDVITAVVHGRPGQAIVEAARDRSVDLIVIGTRGRSGLGRTLLGSVTGDILAGASCSVLVVGPPPRQLTGGHRPNA
jgi:nucleotide-binding universal stress UspA family protein/multisubunit Na+/H+ antiporter MnhG subunit